MRGDPVISVICGGAREDERFRQMNPIVLDEGWNGLVDNHLMPLVERGFRRVHISNPGGLPNEGDMEFDQWLNATAYRDDMKNTEDWVRMGRVVDTDEFVRAISKLTRLGVEVIAYFGCLYTDRYFSALRAGEWLERAMASIQPALDAGCSIGFDKMARVPEDHEITRFIQFLVAKGTKCLVEMWPHKDNHALHHLDWIMLSSMLHSEVHRKAHPWPDNADLVEKIIITTQYPDKDKYIAGVRAMRAFDPTLTPTVPMWRATQWKLRADEIFPAESGVA